MPEWALLIIGQIFTAGAIYGGIKGDIKALIEGVKAAKESADEAHKRIDQILMKG